MVAAQIGASDMAFARMNNFGFWLIFRPPLMLAPFMPAARRHDAERCTHPHDAANGPSMDAAILRCTFWVPAPSWARSISSTILNIAPGMTALMKMPMFLLDWKQCRLLVAVLPVSADAITMF
jgi:cytochrome c oxidase subunit 1